MTSAYRLHPKIHQTTFHIFGFDDPSNPLYHFSPVVLNKGIELAKRFPVTTDDVAAALMREKDKQSGAGSVVRMVLGARCKIEFSGFSGLVRIAMIHWVDRGNFDMTFSHLDGYLYHVSRSYSERAGIPYPADAWAAAPAPDAHPAFELLPETYLRRPV